MSSKIGVASLATASIRGGVYKTKCANQCFNNEGFDKEDALNPGFAESSLKELATLSLRVRKETN